MKMSTTSHFLQPLTTFAWVQTHISQCEVCGGQRGTETLLPVLWFSPVTIIPKMLHLTATSNI